MPSHVGHRLPAALIVVGLLLLSVNSASGQKVVVDADPAHVANTFSPVRSLGAAIDRLRTGTPDHLLKDPLLTEILGAGWQTVTYRQNTELMVEAWHWNPAGKWSNGEKQEGYFVGNAEPTAEMIHSSWAYPLPHRGFSRGDGNGWSRLTDGDPNSYWKSNPYLTKAFTGEEDSLHPQWVMIDLGAKIDVNAIRIAWADPYAKRYAVQFWTGELEPFYEGTTKGTWQTFPLGKHHRRKGRDGHAEAGFVDDSRALHPHLDDRVVQYLRHSRLRRQTQLRGIRDQRTLRRRALGRRLVQRLRHAFPQPRADRDVAFFGRSVDCGD